VLNPVEMGNRNLDDVGAKVKTIAEYQQSFHTVFNGAITMDNIEKAITAYERTQIAFDTPSTAFWRVTRTRSVPAPRADGHYSTARAVA
jgi:cytochrome c peroxidase